VQATLALTLSRRLPWPAWLADAGLVAAGSLFVAALSQVAVPLPFTPVPMTGQTFAVLLVGAVLGSSRGAASLGLYLAEGCLGMPIFAGGQAGPGTLLGPTGGYLVGFVAAAWVVGWLAEHGLDRHWRTALLAFLAGEAVLFAAGVAWLGLFLGRGDAWVAGLWPFLPGEVVKVLLAAFALPSAWALTRGR
jgi:biotin transport system substrate-specific component